MSHSARNSLGSAMMLGRENGQEHHSQELSTTPAIVSLELQTALSDIKGQAQFLLYLAEQIEESLQQLSSESDSCQGAFLCKILNMYSAQLESKHQGLGDKIAETCQEVYVTIREYDPL